MGERGLDPAKRFLFSTIWIKTMSRRKRDRESESENFQMCTHAHKKQILSHLWWSDFFFNG